MQLENEIKPIAYKTIFKRPLNGKLDHLKPPITTEKQQV